LAQAAQNLAEKLKIPNDQPVIFVIGGSQGAMALNQIIALNLEELLKYYCIVHLSGTQDFSNLKDKKEKLDPALSKRYFVFEQVGEDLPAIMKLSDLVISRSGAGAISEIAALGKPSILVPLPDSAQDHQRKNAQVFSEAKAALTIEQENLQTKIVAILHTVLADKKTLDIMGENAKIFAAPEAASKIAKVILDAVK